jgi:hypothetical protein
MKGDHIRYRAGYKYQLATDYSIKTNILGYNIETKYIGLIPNGILTIKEGYAWDGCSGPTEDDETNMRGGLVHDSLYQLMREGHLPEEMRIIADSMLKCICREDGMGIFRAWCYFEGVDHFALYAAKKGTDPYPILMAP